MKKVVTQTEAITTPVEDVAINCCYGVVHGDAVGFIAKNPVSNSYYVLTTDCITEGRFILNDNGSRICDNSLQNLIRRLIDYYQAKVYEFDSADDLFQAIIDNEME